MVRQSRREFLAGAGMMAATAAAGLSGCATRRAIPQWTGTDKAKAVLLHLGLNYHGQWLPADVQKLVPKADDKPPHFTLRTKEELWRRVTNRMAERGLNMVVIDINEALVYPSHPELAVEGSWSPDKLRDEILRLRGIGIEAIPKCNFSATHDCWLKDYNRMISTPIYYQVVKDVIRDVAEIFGTPRLFHLGFDEERPAYAKGCNYFVMRDKELWWHDFLYAIKCAEDCGCRPWVWSDKGWENPEYFKRCPKSVVQSNWFYDEAHGGFDLDANNTIDKKILKEFYELEEAGFDQIPCGSSSPGWRRRSEKVGADDVIGKLVKFGRKTISDEHLKGFMMATWRWCYNEDHTQQLIRGVDLLADALDGKIAPLNKM